MDVLETLLTFGNPLDLIMGEGERVTPVNARAFLKFALGDDAITGKEFSPSEHQAILDLIESAKSDGRSFVTYRDYPSNTISETNMFSDPHGIIQTTLGQFGFEEDEDGYTIKDSYDFNDPEVYINAISGRTGLSEDELKSQGHIERFIDRYKDAQSSIEDVSPAHAAYLALRQSVAPFIDREPMDVKMKVLKN